MGFGDENNSAAIPDE